MILFLIYDPLFFNIVAKSYLSSLNVFPRNLKMLLFR